MRLRSSSVSSVMQPQSVPSRVSVVLAEETEDRDAEYLVSDFADEGVRWSDQVMSPSNGLECVTGPYGTLSPSDRDSVGPIGPFGTLSPSDSDSDGPVGPCGTLSPSDLVGPVGPCGMLFPSDSDSVSPVGPYGTLSTSDSTPVGPVGPYGMLSPSDPVGPVGPYGTLFPLACLGCCPHRILLLLAPLAHMGRCPRWILLLLARMECCPPSDLDSVGPVGLCGMLSPSDSTPVGPVGPCGMLSPSDFDSVGPVGPCGTLSPSDSTPVGPVGPYGMLSPSDPVGLVGPYGTLSPSDSDYVGPVGPFGMLSMPGAVSDGPAGQVQMTSVVGHRNRLSPVPRPGREISSADRARWVPGELIPEICTDLTACKDPIIPFLPADGPAGDVSHAGDVGHAVDMDVMRDSYPAVPAIGDCHAVVAMVGLEAAQRREEAPRSMVATVRSGIFATSLRPLTACQCTVVVICVIRMIQNGMTLGILRLGSMWSDIILMPWTVWN